MKAPLPAETVVRRLSPTYEDAESLQRTAKIAADFVALGGNPPLFGVSGWLVPDMEEPLPAGYARVSTLVAAGFVAMATPQFVGPGHATILLHDPVDDEQAARFNAAFGAKA